MPGKRRPGGLGARVRAAFGYAGVLLTWAPSLAFLVSSTLLAGCSDSAARLDPEATAASFVAAVRNGDRAAAFRLLGPRTRERLQEALNGAKRVSGRLELKPHDFLAVGLAAPAWEPSDFELIEKSGARAVVSVQSSASDRYDLPLLNENGYWRIELPLD